MLSNPEIVGSVPIMSRAFSVYDAIDSFSFFLVSYHLILVKFNSQDQVHTKKGEIIFYCPIDEAYKSIMLLNTCPCNPFQKLLISTQMASSHSRTVTQFSERI